MKLRILRNATVSSAIALCLALVPVAAMAMESGPSGRPILQPRQTNGTSGDQESKDRQNQNSEPESEASDDTATGTNAAGQHKQHRLTGNMLRVCGLRKVKIGSIMDRAVLRGTRQTELFSTIATRVESYYASSGKTLDNYDQLVAAVNSAAAQAQTDLSALKSQGSFSCNGSDPKGQITAFRTAIQTEIKDLKAYRAAVKDLIQGVKSVAGSSGATNSSNSDQQGQGGSQQ